MGPAKKIALVAHDNRKHDLLEWARYNLITLSRHSLFATGTTGRMITEELKLAVMISSPLMNGGYERIVPDYEKRLGRPLPLAPAGAGASGALPA